MIIDHVIDGLYSGANKPVTIFINLANVMATKLSSTALRLCNVVTSTRVLPRYQYSRSFSTFAPSRQASTINADPNFKSGNDSLHEYGKFLISALPKYIQQFSIYKDELTLYVAPDAIPKVFTFLRDHSATQFKQVQDICGVDFPTRSNRFEVVYNLLSVRYNARIRVKTYADETTPVPSIVPLFSGANWFERETYDMYGIFFVGHPDLRRILTDYGFEGYPLRKDFPLTGYVEVRYDEEKKRVVAEPLEMTQAFRNFEGALSPWEQVGAGRDDKPLPKQLEDEKKT